MKKSIKIISFFVLILLILSMASTFAFGDIEPEYTIYDEAGILTVDQAVELDAMLAELSSKYYLHVAVAFTDYLYGDTAMESADDMYDHYGMGIGENYDGILFYVAVEDREYWFSTAGSGIYYFTDYGIEYLKSKVVPYLSQDDFYGAALAYVDAAKYLLEYAETGSPYDVGNGQDPVVGDLQPDRQGFRLMGESGPTPYVIAIVIAFVFAMKSTARRVKMGKTAVKQALANDYIKPGSMQLSYSKDIFLYSHTDVRAKPKDNDSGGSSTHTSSSGRTHGGGGGSF